MKAVLLFLAIAISAVASYFTVSQTNKFQVIQDERLEAIATNVNVSAEIDESTAKIAAEKTRIKAAEDERAVAQSSLTNIKRESDAAESETTDMTAKIAEQEAKIAELKQIQVSVKAELSQVGYEGTIATMSDDFKALEAAIEVKQNTDVGFDESIEKEEKKLTEKREEVNKLNERIQARVLRIALNEIEARVTAVNQDWGFIVIGAGSNSGFMPDTKLLVKRDGRLIGSVKPTAIEPTQTIADIDFSSLAPGVRFQPGDEVILAKPTSN